MRDVSDQQDQPNGQLLCIIPGPTKELARKSAGVRWCFGCRKHLPHDDVCLADDGPSYYDPIWVRECSRCGKDRTAFPDYGGYW